MRKFFKHLSQQQIELGLYGLLIAILLVGATMTLWYTSGVFLNLWALICAVVEPLAYGAMLSYVINPLVKHFSHILRRFKRYAGDENGVRRRTVAVIITLGLIALLLLGLLVAFALMLSAGITKLDWSTLEGIVASATNDISGFLEKVQARLVEWGFLSRESENMLLSTFVNVSNTASTLLFTVIFMVYFLVDGKRLFAYCRRVMVNVFGTEHAADVERLMDDADRVFSGYFRGQAIDALVVGVLSAVALSIVGVPYAPVVGLLSGLGNLIPYLGGPIGFGSVVLVCLSDEAWGAMIWGMVVMALVMFVDGNIINPRLLSDNVEVHPILVVAALIAGGAVGGVAGMLVAVPTAALLKIQLDRWMDANETRGKSLVGEIAGELHADDNEKQ